MKIAEAKQKLMDLADGKFHTLEYKIADHGNGRVSQTCQIYLDGHGSFEAAHWETALAQLEDVIGGRPTLSEDLPISQPMINP
jgi:hypothetical protein